MKSKTVKKVTSMLMAMLIIVSAIAVSANAEELLPEAYGGAIYIGGEVETGQTVFGEPTGESQNTAPADNGGAIYAPGEASSEVNFIGNPGTDNGGAIYSEADVPEMNGIEEGDYGIAPPPVEPEAVPEVETPEPETPEAEEAPETAAESTITSLIAPGIGVEATAVPHPHEYDPDEEAVRGKNHEITQEIGDIIIKIGEGLIPFGPSISDFIRSRSPQGKDMDNVDTAIDLIADTASYACPVAAPLVSVAKDIILKIYNLF